MAYVVGTAHALTGAGFEPIESPWGLLVSLTFVPVWLGKRVGHPDHYVDAGWLSVGNEDGHVAAFRLGHPDELVLGLPDGMTVLGYDLAYGLEATVSELTAGSGGPGFSGGAYGEGVYA